MILVRYEMLACSCRNGGLTKHAIFVGRYGHADRCEDCRRCRVVQGEVQG